MNRFKQGGEEYMPNHVRNVLKFSKLTPKERDFILERFTTEMEDDIYPLNRIFDFDKIIPEPRLESECPEDCKVNKDSHVMEYEDRPWFDWYAWHNKYWGTKWNAYNGYVQVGTTTITFVFNTAWSMPLPVYRELMRAYNFHFTVRYADEDYGSNCGVLEYSPEEGLAHHQSEHDLKNPDSFARRLWDNY